MDGLSPPATVDCLALAERRFFVVREDLLPGGTKQRAAGRYLAEQAAKGYNHFLYASPFCGFAQVALSLACQHLGYRCTIFAEADPLNDGSLHQYSERARQFGAEVVRVDSLAEGERLARLRAAESEAYFQIPLGFNCELFRNRMREALGQEWKRVLQSLPAPPSGLWLPVGSGTLASLFSEIVDSATRLNCVDVHVLPESDSRILGLQQNQRVSLFSCPQRFGQPANFRPNIPSNLHYDAKLWSFLHAQGRDGDVWWNVGP